METSEEAPPTGDVHIDGEQTPQLDSEAWKSVEVVLDAIFKFLPFEDLKNVRLTCKKWCSVGGSALASKAVVRLTNTFEPKASSSGSRSKPSNSSQNFVKHDDGTYADRAIWEMTPSVMYYTTLKEYIRDKVWDSGFRSKTVSILGCHNIWRLPHPQFSAIEQLEVIRFKPVEATWLLQQFRFWFPNLKCLKLYGLQVTDKPNGCVECECICWSRSVHPPDGTLVPSNAGKVQLEKLVMEIGPGCNSVPLDVLMRSTKFRVLELSEASYTTNSPADQLFFVNCLKDFCENVRNLQLVEELILRFGIYNPKDVAISLNKLKVKKLVLLTYGGGRLEVTQLLKGLNLASVHALRELRLFSSWFEGEIVDDELASLFETLGSIGFFKKDVWEISVARFRFIKTERQFVFQAFTKERRTKVLAVVATTLFQQASMANSYNYAFRRAGATGWGAVDHYLMNEMEVFDQPDICSLEKLKAKRKCLKQEGKLPCQRCLNVPKFLCDLPGFLQDAGIELQSSGVSGSIMVTLTFCQVPAEVLSKWTTELKAKQAAKSDIFPHGPDDCF